MRLKYEFAVMDMGDEISAVPVGENAADCRAMLRLNQSGAQILELLKTDTTPEMIKAALGEKYPGSSADEIGRLVDAFLARLSSEELLTDD